MAAVLRPVGLLYGVYGGCSVTLDLTQITNWVS